MKDMNKYVCGGCGQVSVTKMVEPGVTPASLTCHQCNDTAWTVFFDCPQNIQPDYHWFKPTDLQLRKQVDWELGWMGAEGLIGAEEAFNLQKGHVEKGGLVLGPDMETIKAWAE